MDDNFEIIQNPPLDEVLLHYGILGMHWGIRRYQNPDGSLTPEGLERQRKRAERAEIRKEKRKARLDERQRKKEEREREYVARYKKKIMSDPKKLYKHLSEFSYEEIENALKFYDQKRRVHEAKNKKFGQAKDFINTALSYGDVANKTIDFLNSNVGRGVRGKLGLPTNKIFDFYFADEESKRAFQNRMNILYPKNDQNSSKDENKDKDKNNGKNQNNGGGHGGSTVINNYYNSPAPEQQKTEAPKEEPKPFVIDDLPPGLPDNGKDMDWEEWRRRNGYK